MGIKEIMAAKRAAAELAAGVAPVKAVDDTVIDVVAKEVPATAPIQEAAPVQSVSEPVKEEPVSLPGKPMTFAEKMLAKKQQNASMLSPTTGTSTTQEVEAPAKTEAKISPLAHLAEAVNRQAVTEATGDRAARAKDIMAGIDDGTDPTTAQSYVDIKLRIDDLVELSGEPLVASMTELKKALMQNPAAVSLMLDSDIGQMVIALRKMTNVAATEAAKPKKAGPKAKSVSLSAAALELAFDEM